MDFSSVPGVVDGRRPHRRRTTDRGTTYRPVSTPSLLFSESSRTPVGSTSDSFLDPSVCLSSRDSAPRGEGRGPCRPRHFENGAGPLDGLNGFVIKRGPGVSFPEPIMVLREGPRLTEDDQGTLRPSRDMGVDGGKVGHPTANPSLSSLINPPFLGGRQSGQSRTPLRPSLVLNTYPTFSHCRRRPSTRVPTERGTGKGSRQTHPRSFGETLDGIQRVRTKGSSLLPRVTKQVWENGHLSTGTGVIVTGVGLPTSPGRPKDPAFSIT